MLHGICIHVDRGFEELGCASEIIQSRGTTRKWWERIAISLCLEVSTKLRFGGFGDGDYFEMEASVR
jgi:hypothetical protein